MLLSSVLSIAALTTSTLAQNISTGTNTNATHYHNTLSSFDQTTSPTTITLLPSSTVTLDAAQTESSTFVGNEFTVAPWLVNVAQTTIYNIQSFVVAQQTFYETFSFVIPVATQNIHFKTAAGCIAPQSVVVPICPAGYSTITGDAAVTGSFLTTTINAPGSLSTVTINPGGSGIINANVGQVIVIVYVTTTIAIQTSASISTGTSVILSTSNGIQTSLVELFTTTFVNTITSIVTFYITSTITATSTVFSVSNTVGMTGSPGVGIVIPAATSSSAASDTSVTSGTFVITTTSSSSNPSGVSTSTSSAPSPSASSNSNQPGVCNPVPAGATVPQPPANLDLLQVGSLDAPYDLSLTELLASISFPNGLACRENLVILFPGTAVPALDTFTSTFIPVFAPQDAANADVMVVSNPSVSLGDAQTTAEYAAFAINYAALVLGRRATIIPWSQGNLNTQWALKYWPSTRLNLKNYVAMSPDYDGTLQASFLCDPQKLLTQNFGTLGANFLTANGLGTSIGAILGIGAVPTDPEQFRLYLLALLSGMPFSSFNSTNGTITASTSAISASSLTSTSSLPTILPGLNVTKRALHYGIPRSETRPQLVSFLEMRAAQEHRLGKRQTGTPSAVGQLLGGLLGPIATALSDLLAMPDSVLAEVLANGQNLLTLMPAVLPQGCLPAIWQQVYFSNFVNTLAQDFGNGAGDVAFVPTTTVLSITDEVVQPQGATGFENASGFLKGVNASNIFIQGNGGCPIVPAVLISGLPSVITHEGVLYSGMGVEAAVIAVRTGGLVTVDQIPADLRCAFVSPRLTPQQALAQEATIPGALVRVLVGDGDASVSSFTSAEPPIKAYATQAA